MSRTRIASVSQPGWYPDPGGQGGAFRFWDGRAWSASTTTNPQSPPPAGSLGQPAPTSGYGAGTGYGTTQYGSGTTYAPAATTPTKRRGVWWIIAIALAVVILIAAVLGIRALINRGEVINAPNPGGTSTREICPQAPTDNSPAPQPNDGRVHGGQLSYPLLGSPWAAPSGNEFRVPFGRGVLSQSVIVEPQFDNRRDWVASVLIGELVAGDGFFSPQEGSEIVVKCIVGSFYGPGTAVAREDQKNEALEVDGKDAWVVESHLTFDIEGLKTKGELLIVVIVATSAASSSLYYASIPDTVPDLVQPARDAMKNLKVDS